MPPEIRAWLDRERHILIDGKRVLTQSGKIFEVPDSATGGVIARVSEGDKADVDLAGKAALRAFERGPWPKMTPSARGRPPRDLILERSDELDALEAIDNAEKRCQGRRSDALGGHVPIMSDYATKMRQVDSALGARRLAPTSSPCRARSRSAALAKSFRDISRC